MTIKYHNKTNEQVRQYENQYEDFTLTCKLGDVLREKGISMKQLSNRTGIRIATISEMVNQKRSTINMSHLIVIAKELRITNLETLYAFDMSEETRSELEAASLSD